MPSHFVIALHNDKITFQSRDGITSLDAPQPKLDTEALKDCLKACSGADGVSIVAIDDCQLNVDEDGDFISITRREESANVQE